jgi:predicted ribosome quality control (RQC) complex YloA/Tae2 family protein
VYDALTIAAIVAEMNTELDDGRIQQAVQIDPLTIALEVYAQRRRRWLVAGATPDANRLFLTSRRIDGDSERVSPLLLLLRKYARGGRIVSITQPRDERIVRVSIAKALHSTDDDAADDGDARHTQGELTFSDLYVELMGRHANVILVNPEGRIMDALKRVTPQMSRVRQVRPNLPWEPPPPQQKDDPRLARADGIVRSSRDVAEPLSRWLVATYRAISPVLAREIAVRAGLDPELPASALDSAAAGALRGAIASVFAPLESGGLEPFVYRMPNGRVDFSSVRLVSLEQQSGVEVTPYASISEAAEAAWDAGRSSAPTGSERHAARRERLVAEIDEARERTRHRLHSLGEQQDRAAEAERWRQMGEAIYTAFADIRPGQQQLQTEDGFIVPLDPTLSLSQNAQEYFERYRKARSAEENLPELVERAQHEARYLDQLRALAALAEGYDEIESVRLEWQAWTTATPGAPKAARPTGARPAAAARRPRSYRTARGDTILVGRTGPQNDAVTFDIAGPGDLWLHARNMPGAHVILRRADTTSDDAVAQAASLAAWYSDGRHAGSVPVDVTERRYVRKIKGSGPGLVTYRNERTLNVHPASEQELGLEPSR